MSLKKILKGLAIAGATYAAVTGISNALFGTKFKTVGDLLSGIGGGGGGGDAQSAAAANTDANLGAALQKTSATAAAVSGGGDDNTATVGKAASGDVAGTNAATAAPASMGGAGGLLKKAAGAAWDFAKSPAGGTVIGTALQGYAAGKAKEAEIKEQRRYTRQFTPEELAAMHTGAPGGAPDPHAGYLNRARRVSEFLGGYPSVAGPANPTDLAAMARGGQQ